MQLKVSKAVSIIFGLAISGSLFASPNDCQPVSGTTAARLAQYVHDKFGFPPTTVIKMGTAELVESSCYRKVTFVRSQVDGTSMQQAVLYLSPDQLFLTHDIMDTTMEPAEEKRNEQRRLQVVLTAGTFPALGPQKATITITEFADFECPYCKQEAEILRKRILPGSTNVRLVFRNLPLPNHPWARAAAEMATCVYQQSNDAFWDLHDSLFRNQEKIAGDNLKSVVEQVISGRMDIDIGAYHTCVSGHQTSDLVEQDIAFARDLGIQGTPTIFINEFRNDDVMKPEETEALIRKISSESKASAAQ